VRRHSWCWLCALLQLLRSAVLCRGCRRQVEAHYINMHLLFDKLPAPCSSYVLSCPSVLPCLPGHFFISLRCSVHHLLPCPCLALPWPCLVLLVLVCCYVDMQHIAYAPTSTPASILPLPCHPMPCRAVSCPVLV
jgi:hypothetical protein